MAFSVEFRDRGGSPVRGMDGLTWTVGPYSARAIGGCEEASLTVTGEIALLWGLLEWLRYHVTIRNENGNAVWWGFVAAVEVGFGGITVGMDVETVRNRVCVAYTYRDADGSQVRDTTTWGEDLPSQATYGVHEEILSMGDITATVATSRRDAYLAMRKEPARTLTVGGGAVGATVRCVGWWHQLDWRYWAQLAGFETYAGKAKEEHVISFALTSTEIGFRLPNHLVDILGRLDVLTKGQRIIVYGSAGNDYIYTVKDPPRSPEDDAVAYTSDLVWFDPQDDIFDVNEGLAPFKSGDLIKISGGSHSGYWKVNKAGVDHIEVNPKSIAHADVGPDITIRRGHTLEIEESFASGANPGPSILIATIGTMIAQSFTPSVATAWTAYELVVYARRIGAPGDNLKVGIWSNSSGSPGSLLASGTVTGSSLSDELEQVSINLSSLYALTYGTTYWLVAERTGSADPENMFAIGLDEGLGHSGSMKIWNNGPWETRIPDCDMPFEIWGKRETTLQIQDMLSYVFPAVSIETASGVYARQWRNGEQTVRAEVEELLAAGTSSERRLLAQMTADKVVRIYAEPDPSSLSWQLGMYAGSSCHWVRSMKGSSPPGSGCSLLRKRRGWAHSSSSAHSTRRGKDTACWSRAAARRGRTGHDAAQLELGGETTAATPGRDAGQRRNCAGRRWRRSGGARAQLHHVAHRHAQREPGAVGGDGNRL